MDLTNPAPLSLPTLLLNLLLGLVLSVLMSSYYVAYGESFSNRAKFAKNIPLLTLITLIVISIVKSSLALSLGLVGALSIVRFRTAIKDPEELIYLFFAIAIGLGMGADQRVPTLAAYALIMIYLIFRRLIIKTNPNSHGDSLYLNIRTPLETSTDKIISSVNHLLAENFKDVDFRRMDVSSKELQLVYYFNTHDPEAILQFTTSIQEMFPNASLSIIEQNNMLGG
jgi:hypothetical protein